MKEWPVAGDAKLFCADARDLYEEFCGSPHTLIFDPPWEKATEFSFTQSDNILAFCDGFRAGDIIRIFGSPTWVFGWDCVTSWYTPNRPLRRMKMCFWYGDITTYQQKGWLYGEPCGNPRKVKNSRGEYLFTPDDGKMLSDLFVCPITSLHKSSGPSHGKPVEWLALLIANVLRDGDIVLDPFAGTGATLNAARLVGKSWVGGDIDKNACEQMSAMSENAADFKWATKDLFEEL